MVIVNGEILPRTSDLETDRRTCLKLEKPRAYEAGDLSPKSGKKWTFSLPLPLPALPLTQF